MAFDERLADRARKVLRRRKGYAEKKMFGGIGFLLHRNLCCGVLRSDLILRLGPDRAEIASREPHTKPFDITGRAMTGWLMVGADGLHSDEALQDWIGQAVEFVSTLPSK